VWGRERERERVGIPAPCRRSACLTREAGPDSARRRSKQQRISENGKTGNPTAIVKPPLIRKSLRGHLSLAKVRLPHLLSVCWELWVVGVSRSAGFGVPHVLRNEHHSARELPARAARVQGGTPSPKPVARQFSRSDEKASCRGFVAVRKNGCRQQVRSRRMGVREHQPPPTWPRRRASTEPRMGNKKAPAAVEHLVQFGKGGGSWILTALPPSPCPLGLVRQSSPARHRPEGTATMPSPLPSSPPVPICRGGDLNVSRLSAAVLNSTEGPGKYRSQQALPSPVRSP
jgi:hypothetical protein